MRIAKSDYTFKVSDFILIIQDLDMGRKSVTSDMVNVLSEIKRKIGDMIHDLDIIYCDAEGIWDGVISEWTTEECSDINFYHIGEMEMLEAIKKIKK